MGKRKHVRIHLHDVRVQGNVTDLTVKVPYPRGLSKSERSVFADGAAEACAIVVAEFQPRHVKTGFGPAD